MNIDALVATRVMGWTPDELGCYATDRHPSHGGRVRWCVEDSDALDSLNDAEVWSPSTDPAAMMVVKARLLEIDREKHGGMTGLYSTWNPYNCRWEVKIDWSSNKRFEAKHENECMAWCLLGLAVVGTTEDEITKALEER